MGATAYESRIQTGIPPGLCLRHYVFALISKDPLQIALQHNAVRFKYDVLLGMTLDLQAV